MIEKSQNKSRSGRKNISFRGCSQRQYNYFDPFPHCGRGFQHGGGRYLPRQTSGPTFPIVAPLQQACCEICEVNLTSHKLMEQHKNGKRHQRLLKLHEELQRQKAINGQESGQMPNSLMNLVFQPEKVQESKKNGCLVENVSSEAIIDKHKDYLRKDIGETSEVPAEEPKGEPRDNFAVRGHRFKRKITGAGGGKCMKSDNGIRRPLESSKSDVNALSNYVVSHVQVPAVAPSQGPVASQIMASTPVVGSRFELQFQHVSASQIQVSEAKAHHEIQNLSGETNVQPRSISVELHAPAGSSINTQTEYVSSDSAAITIAPPPGPAASQVFAPTPAVGSSFEPQIQHVSLTQVSEAITHYESQNPTGEENIQLPSSVLMEFDAPAGSSINTQTADGSSEAEEKMDVLTNVTTELGITQLAQVTVCLKCGNRGFPETLVFCSKCQVYALHRYCLDGPVIFVEDVTWFCEDCEAKVVDASHDESTPLPSGTIDSVNLAKDAIQARIELTNCIKRVKKNKQQQQKIEKKQKKRKVISGCVAKTKSLLSDSHTAPHHEQTQCSNNCEEENKFNKECQPVPTDAANSNEGSVTVQISQVATSGDLNFVELDGHADAQPIADPIWRGSLCLCNESSGTVCGLLAHLSCLACSKVLEETRFFPEVLCADLLQRSAVWPKGFKQCGPTDQSIALYFFPENDRAEKAFDKLVDDLIRLDLAMRAVVENAELLVFPSTVLPIQYWRFQAKYYLWGVFRAKQTSSKTNDAGSGEDTGVESVDKPLTRHNHSPSNTLRNSGSSGSNTQ